jgi:hypothetical protein
LQIAGFEVRAVAEVVVQGDPPALALVDPLLPIPGAAAAVAALRKWAGRGLTVALMDRARHRIANPVQALAQFDVEALVDRNDPQVVLRLRELAEGRPHGRVGDDGRLDRRGELGVLGSTPRHRGDLRAEDPPTLAMAFWQSRRSGLLEIENDAGLATLWFRRGTVVYADIEDPRSEVLTRVAAVLKVERDRVAAASGLAAASGRSLVSQLAGQGLVGLVGARRAMDRVTDALAAEVLQCSSGTWRIRTRVGPPPEYAGTGLPTPLLVARAIFGAPDEVQSAQAVRSWTDGLLAHASSKAIARSLPGSDAMLGILREAGSSVLQPREYLATSKLPPKRAVRLLHMMVATGVLVVHNDRARGVPNPVLRSSDEIAADRASLLEALGEVSQEQRLEVARSNIEGGHHALAAHELLRSVSRNGWTLEVMLLLAEALEGMPKTNEIAIADIVPRLTRAAAERPNDARAPFWCGRLLRRVGDDEQAKAMLRKAAGRGGPKAEEARFLISEGT